MYTLLSLLILLFGGMLAFSLGKHFYFFKKSKFSLVKLNIFSAIFLSLSIVLGGTFLYGNYSELPIYTWIVMLILLWALYYFPLPSWTKKQDLLFLLTLCALGVFGVLMSLPEMSIGYWLKGITLTLAWLMGWYLFSYFDRYPLATHMVSGGWTLALLLISLITPIFPIEVTLFAGILGISIYVICSKRISYGIFNLGFPTVKIAGFAWAGVWTICLLQANIAILLLVYGYYLTELLVLLKYRKKQQPTILLQKALSDNKNRKKALFIVLSHTFLMAFLATVLTITVPKPHVAILTCMVFMFVICYDLYIKLNNLDRKVGSWKDIFSELKKGVSELPKASKAFAKEVKSGLKTQSRKKKTSGKKKGIKKKK